MDTHALRVLEFHRLRDMLAARTASVSGREVATTIEPYRDSLRIRTSLKQTDEARAALDRGEALPLGAFEDVRALIERVHDANRTFEPVELVKIADAIMTAKSVRSYLIEKKDLAAELLKLADQLPNHEALWKAIDEAVEAPGSVKDAASERLWELRRAIKNLEEEIRDLLGEIMNRSKVKDALQAPTISLRNGRFVLPVKVDMKGHVPGMLHDLSQTGATVFIEPAEIVPMTNRLREFRLEQAKEERRILWEKTRQVFAARATLVAMNAILAWFDFTQAKARLSRDFSMISPGISADGRLRLVAARHPLLWAAKLDGHAIDVVPLDVRLREGFRILVITGPNTGGKTVALKTVGLLQLMAQAGMHVPAASGTVLPILTGVFADIGDEQSIDQSLSTFSGHIKNVAEIVKVADERSLVLLDELGAGTEPSEGASLGTAILDRLRALGASCIVTTHLGALKDYALSHADVENACVEFDSERMRPTYRLLVGQPGNSNALAIARRYGLDEDIIRAAREKLDQVARPGEEIVDKLLESRRALEETRQESEKHLERSKNLARAAEERMRHLEKRASRVEVEADQVIDDTLKNLAKRLEPPLRELANVPKILKPAVDEVGQALKDALKDSSIGAKRRAYIATLKKDDPVWVPRLGQAGRIRKFDREAEKITVLFGKMTVEVDYDDIALAGTGPIQPPAESGPRPGGA